MTTRQRLSAHVIGRVQGVGFRYFTQRQARALGLVGWVRNEYDGSVRLEAEGPHRALNDLLDAVRKGPPSARVDHVAVHWSEAAGEFVRFSVRF